MPWMRFTAEVGIFRRAGFRHEMKNIANRAGLDNVELDEDRGVLTSYFIVRMAGPTERLEAAKRAVVAMREIEEMHP